MLTPPARTEGRIERVIDGDTADIASACRRFRVRFSGVDAPELGRPEGDRARDWVRTTFEDRAVRWSAVGVDVYGRFLGDLQLADGTSVNQEIIRHGYARPYGEPSAEPPRPAQDRVPSACRASAHGLKRRPARRPHRRLRHQRRRDDRLPVG